MARRTTSKPYVPRLHHRIGLHPVFLLALCIIGVVLLAATIRVFADQTYTVRATVEADPITVAATIIRPADDSRTAVAKNDIVWTCPTFSYVKLYIDGSFHGTAVCDITGQFILTTTLSPGRNVVMAQVYNLTDQPGPASETVTVYYDAPVVNAPAKVTENSPATAADEPAAANDEMVNIAPTGSQLEFLCECNYQARYVDDAIEIPVSVKGGAAPYDINIDWGDGTADTYLDQPGPVVVISHRYKPFSAGLKAFTINIDITDAVGVKATYQIYQLVRNTAFQPAVVGPALPVKNVPWLTLLPAFAIVVLLIFVFWLGERHELDMAREKTRAKPRPPRHRHS